MSKGLLWLKRHAGMWLWKYHRHYQLDRKGFRFSSVHQEEDFLNLYVKVISDNRVCMSFREIYNLYALVQRTQRVKGDIAEVGVYRGGSARVICEAKGARTLHLFDTFEGMPDACNRSERAWRGSFSKTSVMGVAQYLAAFDNVHVHKGRFPESAEPLTESRAPDIPLKTGWLSAIAAKMHCDRSS
ncbi:TylF/MycF/NovP-related O-methyltransferase [Planctomycetota bacterium]